MAGKVKAAIAYAVGVNHVRGEKKPGIFPRKIAHVAHKTAPTKRPKRALVSMPHACQSQSPAQELVDDWASAEADGTDEKECGNTAEDVEEVEAEEVGKDDDVLDNSVDDAKADDIDEVDEAVVLDDEGLDVRVDEIEVDRDRLELVELLELEDSLPAVRRLLAVVNTVVCVVHIATPSAFVVVVIVLSTVIPNSR